MKLLYVWIEEFRNIKQQGFIVDNEYKVSAEIPDGDSFGFYDSRGSRVLGASSGLWRKIFYRKFNEKTIAILTILVTHLFKVSQLLQVKMPLVSPALLNASINERISLIMRIRKSATFFWFSWILTIIR